MCLDRTRAPPNNGMQSHVEGRGSDFRCTVWHWPIQAQRTRRCPSKPLKRDPLRSGESMSVRISYWAAAASLLSVACATTPTSGDDWAAVLYGSWGWTQGELTCEANPHEIAFSSGRRFIDLEFREPVPGARGTPERHYRYRVLKLGSSSARMQIEGETRMTDEGELVVWDLVMLTHDEYCWHRTDWPAGACTARIARCD